MNATLLCPGPSLAHYKPQARGGMVVAVNRAASLHACDVWAATDRPLIDKVKPIGLPVLFTISATRDSLARRGRPWPWLVVTHDGIAGETVNNSKHPWTRYTATAALYYLYWCGAERIDVYGSDMAGDADWDGVRFISGRTDKRWAEERGIWTWLTERMHDEGIEVVRHTSWD